MAYAAPGLNTRRLQSWKDIAAYLGRDVRTVIRWEKEKGLPVYRDTSGPGRPTVYAYADELDRWLLGHPAETDSPGGLLAIASDEPPKKTSGVPKLTYAALALGFAVALMATGTLWQRRSTERHLQFTRLDLPAAGAKGIETADIDSDGNLDLIFTNSANDTVDIAFGDGRGAFPRRASISSAREPERLAVGDFNHDGRLDLAVTHRSSQVLMVYLADAKGEFHPTFTWPMGGRSRWVSTADLNGDNKMDLVVACSSAHKVAVMLGNGDGTFTNTREYDTNGEPSSVIIGDFNHDGIPDFVTADYQASGGRTVSLFAGRGDGTFQSRYEFPAGKGPLGMVAADFNRDGLLDLSTADFHDGVSILLGTQSGFALPKSFEARSAPGFVAAGDVDADGNPDLLMVAEHSNDVHLYYGNGRGDFVSSQVFATGSYPDAIAVGDFDHDGHLDFAVANTYGNSISVFLNRTPR